VAVPVYVGNRKMELILNRVIGLYKNSPQGDYFGARQNERQRW